MVSVQMQATGDAICKSATDMVYISDLMFVDLGTVYTYTLHSGLFSATVKHSGQVFHSVQLL